MKDVILEPAGDGGRRGILWFGERGCVVCDFTRSLMGFEYLLTFLRLHGPRAGQSFVVSVIKTEVWPLLNNFATASTNELQSARTRKMLSVLSSRFIRWASSFLCKDNFPMKFGQSINSDRKTLYNLSDGFR